MVDPAPRLRGADLVAGGAVVLTSLVVWLPVLRSDFFCDEISSMIYLASEGPLAFVLEIYGGHLLHLRNLIFWATYEAAGLHPVPYLATALATHLLNVALLYALARLWFGSVLVALAVALSWGTAPILAGSLEWYAAYGHVLAATCFLIALLVLGRHVARAEPIGLRAVAVCTISLTLGATCFGTGIAVALVFPLVAWLLVPPSLWGRRARASLALLPGIVLAIFTAAPHLHAQVAVARGWPMRPSSVLAFVGFEPLRAVADLVAAFMAAATSSLLAGWRFGHLAPGDTPWSVPLLAAAVVSLVLTLATRGGESRRRIAALLLVAVAGYGIVATGRAQMLSSRGAGLAEAAAVSRFHYLPSLAIALMLGVGLDAARGLRWMRTAGPALAIGIWLFSSATAWSRSPFVPVDRTLFRAAMDRSLATADAQIDAAPSGATVVLVNDDPSPGRIRGILPFAHLPGRAGFVFARSGSDQVRGRTVRFVEPDPAKRAAVRSLYSGAMRDLLVSTEEGVALRRQAQGGAR